MSALGGLAAALELLVLCKVLDRDAEAAAGMRWVAEATVFVANTRLLRLLWVFRRIIDIATKPVPGPTRRAEPIKVRAPAGRR
jgi:hypothetical protein